MPRELDSWPNICALGSQTCTAVCRKVAELKITARPELCFLVDAPRDQSHRSTASLHLHAWSAGCAGGRGLGTSMCAFCSLRSQCMYAFCRRIYSNTARSASMYQLSARSSIERAGGELSLELSLAWQLQLPLGGGWFVPFECLLKSDGEQTPTLTPQFVRWFSWKCCRQELVRARMFPLNNNSTTSSSHNVNHDPTVTSADGI